MRGPESLNYLHFMKFWMKEHMTTVIVSHGVLVKDMAARYL